MDIIQHNKKVISACLTPLIDESRHMELHMPGPRWVPIANNDDSAEIHMGQTGMASDYSIRMEPDNDEGCWIARVPAKAADQDHSKYWFPDMRSAMAFCEAHYAVMFFAADLSPARARL